MKHTASTLAFYGSTRAADHVLYALEKEVFFLNQNGGTAYKIMREKLGYTRGKYSAVSDFAWDDTQAYTDID